jgi:hypothetical protein
VLADKWRGDGGGLWNLLLKLTFFTAEGADPAAAAGAANVPYEQSPCAQWRFNFDQCVSQNQNNIAACQFTWDSYRECMNNMQQQQQNNWS